MAYGKPYGYITLPNRLKILVSELVNGESSQDFNEVNNMVDEYYRECAITSSEYQQIKQLLEGYI